MFNSQDDLSKVIDGTTKALVDVRSQLNLPRDGYVVYPYFYCAKKCLYLGGKLSSEYKSLAYKYAGGMLLLSGPHMIMLFRTLDPIYVDILFSIQILLFLIYVVKRKVLLDKAKKFKLNCRPLTLYTDGIATYVKKSVLMRTLLGFLLIFGLMGGFMIYSFFIKEYYFLFLFMLTVILWLTAGAAILSLTIVKAFKLTH